MAYEIAWQQTIFNLLSVEGVKSNSRLRATSQIGSARMALPLSTGFFGGPGEQMLAAHSFNRFGLALLNNTNATRNRTI
jgi:hypothetical protein